MSKNKKRKSPPAARQHTAAPAQSMEAFTFGEPVPVLDKREILDYVECIDNGSGTSRRSVSPGWRKACAPPFTTARRCTLSATFWYRRLSRTNAFHVRILAALRWITWFSVTRLLRGG
jgi:hypothetical protein